ncbi:ribosome maturation factor RimP [Anaerofustis sp.]|uniref:ribosome maturation factor RimP n=1 Tax=Anaerofustis sp. TaxID=1872517 RepID=UPI0025B7D094|nr:ribosome maturation factor RimP [Anaerofustis sp.]
MKVTDRVEALSEDILRQNECELVDIEFKKEGNNKVLRLYIERIEGKVNLDDISNVTRLLSKLLDEEDFIEEEYILEVSSPGVNRVIKKEKDFVKFTGSKVDVALFKPIDKRKKFTGILEGYKDNNIHVLVEGEHLVIPHDAVSKVNLSFDFKF